MANCNGSSAGSNSTVGSVWQNLKAKCADTVVTYTGGVLGVGAKTTTTTTAATTTPATAADGSW